MGGDGALGGGAGAAGAAFAFPTFLFQALVEPAAFFLVAALHARGEVRRGQDGDAGNTQ